MSRRLRSLLLAGILLAAGEGAMAGLQVLEAAHELDPGQVSLPMTTSGSLRLHPCAGCDPVSLQLDDGTVFQVLPGTGNTSLEGLRREAARLAHRPRTSLFVFFDPRSGIVRRVVLDATQ